MDQQKLWEQFLKFNQSKAMPAPQASQTTIVEAREKISSSKSSKILSQSQSANVAQISPQNSLRSKKTIQLKDPTHALVKFDVVDLVDVVRTRRFVSCHPRYLIENNQYCKKSILRKQVNYKTSVNGSSQYAASVIAIGTKKQMDEQLEFYLREKKSKTTPRVNMDTISKKSSKGRDKENHENKPDE
jgi:hypothetical protein